MSRVAFIVAASRIEARARCHGLACSGAKATFAVGSLWSPMHDAGNLAGSVPDMYACAGCKDGGSGRRMSRALKEAKYLRIRANIRSMARCDGVSSMRRGSSGGPLEPDSLLGQHQHFPHSLLPFGAS